MKLQMMLIAALMAAMLYLLLLGSSACQRHLEVKIGGAIVIGGC